MSIYFNFFFIVYFIQNYKIFLFFKYNLCIAKINNIIYINHNLNHAILLLTIQYYLQNNLLYLYDLFKKNYS